MRKIEDIEQKNLFLRCNLYASQFKELRLLFAIINESSGGTRNDILRGRRFKLLGRKAGVPDICLPVARKGYHGLFIELKKPKKYGKSYPSKEQKTWIRLLAEQGYLAVICHGCDEAWNTIIDYLNSK